MQLYRIEFAMDPNLYIAARQLARAVDADVGAVAAYALFFLLDHTAAEESRIRELKQILHGAHPRIIEAGR